MQQQQLAVNSIQEEQIRLQSKFSTEVEDILNALNLARIFSVGPGALQAHAARAEPLKGLFHQPPFGRHAKFQRHCPASSSSIRPGRITPPTAGISSPCPNCRVSAS